LERHFGSGKGTASTKKGYRLQHEVCTNADLSGLINSDAIQNVVKAAKTQAKRTRGTKPNPLVNRRAMAKLNPYSTVLRALRQKNAGVKAKISKADKSSRVARSKVNRKGLQTLLVNVEAEVDGLTQVYRDQIASMNVRV
jgi:large subunit ribosomal protein L4e